LRIAFITDLHIDEDGKFPLNLDTRRQFLSVLSDVTARGYDRIVLGGDICHQTGEAETYQWIADQIAAAGIPCLSIAGNHDDSSLLAKYLMSGFPVSQGELYFYQIWEEQIVLFLDTSKGRMSDIQYKWLNDQIELAGRQIYIFMHHPPLLCGSLHMEPTYQFSQMDQFKALCSKWSDRNFKIITGHYHLDRYLVSGNMSVLLTPSTFVQIDPESTAFRPLNNNIGYREVIFGDGTFITNTRYLKQIIA
jgi:Icc protein